jgi:hypothetical protein
MFLKILKSPANGLLGPVVCGRVGLYNEDEGFVCFQSCCFFLKILLYHRLHLR